MNTPQTTVLSSEPSNDGKEPSSTGKEPTNTGHELTSTGKALTLQQSWRILLIALGISAALVGFLIRGSWSLGLTLSLLVLEIGMFLYHGVSGRSASQSIANRGRVQSGLNSRKWLAIALCPVVLALGATSFIFANVFLRIINFPVILTVLIVQFILLFNSSDHDWDEPGFWFEVGLAGFARPFVRLPALGSVLAGLSARRSPSADAAGQKKDKKVIGFILLGLVAALPVLIIAGLLMASADAVFAGVFANLSQFWLNLSLKDRLIDLLLILIFFPFIFSILESGRSRWQAWPRQNKTAQNPGVNPLTSAALSEAPASSERAAAIQDAAARHARTLSVHPAFLVTFLMSINLLYLLFSLIQLTYLTGAFQSRLPVGMTYAEYARNGFFELAAVSAINVGLIIFAVKGSERKRIWGALLRSQNLLLVLASMVQWLSAMFRMILYVETYGLTVLRFFVSAFMILIAAWFILLVIKEFRKTFPLFKAGAIAALLSLLLLNFVNPDAWIARHNVGRYLADPAHPIDLKYFEELSPDAVPAMLELADHFGSASQNSQAGQLQTQLETIEEDLQNKSQNPRWQSWNASERRNLTALKQAADH